MWQLPQLHHVNGSYQSGCFVSLERRAISTTGALQLIFLHIPCLKVRCGSYLFIKIILQDIIELSFEEIVNENLLSTLDEMTRDEQYHWVVEGAFAMFRTILSQREYSIRSV